MTIPISQITIAALVTVAIIAIIAYLLIFWRKMITDCSNREFKDKEEKAHWMTIIMFGNWIGALIYYFKIKLPNRH